MFNLYRNGSEDGSSGESSGYGPDHFDDEEEENWFYKICKNISFHKHFIGTMRRLV